MAIPDFLPLSMNYLNYWFFTPESVKSLIGGEVDSPDITSTCAIRMSYALNRCGVKIPSRWESISNRRGKDGDFYIIRVVNLRTWMTSSFGQPDYDFRKSSKSEIDRNQFKGLQGIIALEIGFNDATGHFDLWSANQFTHEFNGGETYFQRATRISLWSTKAPATKTDTTGPGGRQSSATRHYNAVRAYVQQ